MVSSEPLPVLFLWHHHQPFYQGPDRARPVLPWVRLHAARGYLDTVTAARENEAAVTFNFSPCLLEQLIAAKDLDPRDEFERIALIPPPDLTVDEKSFLLAKFFSVNWSVHVRPHPRYSALLAKRGERPDQAALLRTLEEFTHQDYMDLAALFHLSWMGFAARRRPDVAELLKKQSDYTRDDLLLIVRVQREIMDGIVPAYRELYDRGTIEISVSPYTHAILPLLCGTQSAAPDIPRQQLPQPDYRYPEDAVAQLKSARELHERLWGLPARGLWPSEGSVSEEALDLVATCGFEWLATDQGILERSDRTRADGAAHFTSYNWAHSDRTLRLFFRDRGLSDGIGFRYSSMNPTEAAADLTSSLRYIEKESRPNPVRCVVIALDGENPWENYPDGGEGFLQSVYHSIRADKRLQLTTFSRQSEHTATERIHRIHAGSWIDANFRIWIGDPEKNRAWMELERARARLQDLLAGDPRLGECRKWLMRAQGSDWFWWFGEPFTSPYDSHFDELFRSYLKAVYMSANFVPPLSLENPISSPLPEERRLQPFFPISPQIDGRETSFYEWMGASRIDPRQYGTAMGRSEHPLRAAFYAFGERDLFFRCDPAATIHPQTEMALVLHVVGQKSQKISIPFHNERLSQTEDGCRWVRGDVIEIALAYDAVGIVPGGECQFWIEIRERETLLDKLPPSGLYRFIVPTAEMIAAHWIV
ncbi:MAG: glycoside hydrolase family 57 protein [bacterium]|nr:glycoside hydrolase family 57 protein [bacterium]